MKKYYVSKHDIYDSDKRLWSTSIGLDNQSGEILYTCWGTNFIKSRANASALVKALERDQNKLQTANK